jgi:DNA-binding winged helix-turn-helix (wHTH) protein
MPAQPARPAHLNSTQMQSRSVSKVLLVGGEDFLINRASSHVYFGGQQARVVGKAVKLSEALPRLKPGGIDIVWLSCQFSSEELLHFAFDAKANGYQGVILQAQSSVLKPSDPRTPCAKKPIRAGDFVIDMNRYQVWVRGKDTQLTPQELALLSYFSKHPRELLTHEHLLEILWGGAAAPIAPLRVLIQTLRAKIEITASPRYIVTQYRLGYRFNPSPYPFT